MLVLFNRVLASPDVPNFWSEFGRVAAFAVHSTSQEEKSWSLRR